MQTSAQAALIKRSRVRCFVDWRTVQTSFDFSDNPRLKIRFPQDYVRILVKDTLLRTADSAENRIFDWDFVCMRF